jgi:hypothetical protein
MAVEEALISLVLADAAVAALIAERFYPVGVPQDDPLPAATYQMISAGREQNMAGPDGLVEARFQVNCWAGTYVAAYELAEKVRLCLNGQAAVTVAAVYISLIELLDEGDTPVIVPESSRQDTYGRRMDFRVWFKE